MDQNPYVPTAEEVAMSFAQNSEPRCHCVLLLDVSTSMKGEPIQELNKGLVAFKESVALDTLASKRLEISVITFGPTKVVSRALSPEDFIAPRLIAMGNTPTGTALLKAVELINDRKAEYKANGIPHYRPWIILMTDGNFSEPKAIYEKACKVIFDGSSSKQFSFFPIGINNADLNELDQIAPPIKALKLRGLSFEDLFSWLSSSLKSVSASSPGQIVALPPTTWSSTE